MIAATGSLGGKEDRFYDDHQVAIYNRNEYTGSEQYSYLPDGAQGRQVGVVPQVAGMLRCSGAPLRRDSRAIQEHSVVVPCGAGVLSRHGRVGVDAELHGRAALAMSSR